MAIDLQSELTALRRTILTMGAEVESRINLAIVALTKRDAEAARTVREGDDEIDAMEIEIEQECLRILALSQPVAGDLRFVLAVMRINSEVERIADMARGIAKRALDLQRCETIELPDAVVEMAAQVQQMYSKALVALAEEDATIAQRVRESDQRVDDLQKEVFVWVQREIPDHVEATQAAIDVLSVARKLERIADVSTNIAEDIIFLTEGSLVRHAQA
jgi:phosphate transport system protein